MLSKINRILRSLIEWIRSKLIICGISGLVLLVLWVLYLTIWTDFNWPEWTGFSEYKGKTPCQYQCAKTLWDWMHLLIVPAVLASGGWFLNKSQQKQKWEIDNSQKKLEWQKNKSQKKREWAIATERYRQTMFESYLDKMTDMLLKEKLCEAESNAGIKIIARVRTLTLLENLDGKRKGSIVKFLYESELIKVGSKKPIDLKFADLKGVQLAWANLEGIDLSRALMGEADLKWAHMEGATLIEAEFIDPFKDLKLVKKSDLQGIYLQEANLQRANLSWANLKEAHLQNANLNQVHLEGAILIGANLNGASLEGARYNQHTIWPDCFDLMSVDGLINVDIHPDKADWRIGP